MKNGDTMEITKLDRTPDGIYGASIEDEGRSYVVAGKPGREITHALLIKEPGREWVIVRPRKGISEAVQKAIRDWSSQDGAA